MAAAAWERFTGHRWLPKAAAAVLAAALAAGFLLVRSELRDARNAEVLETACGGVLPREAVRGLLPGDETWELRDDLDLTGPSGRGPRTLLRCSVGWDEFWGGGYGDLRLAAVPVLDAPLSGVRLKDVLATRTVKEPRWATEHLHATTQVTADCPDGLAGYPRPVTRFRVHASLSADGAEVAGAAEELGEVVAAAADRVRVRGGCGGRVVEPSDVRPPAPGPAEDPYEESEEVPPSCRWFRPGMLDGGDPDPDGVTHDEVDACSVRVTRVKPTNRLDHFASVSSVSWRGRLLPEARTAYGAELAALSRAPEPEGGEKSYTLAVWAESSCSGARTLSRVAVETAGSALAADRADRILDAYLTSSGCRAVKVLGKVWK
ncbi:hypothetical protein ACFVAO_03590 [Streptomyces californicus]|uniref:hypothetical protein n=1 Tax=Streptomyces californicus TaxID=67351 RepID=UPI00367B0A61